jgi:uncharacterized membrane protein YqhA
VNDQPESTIGERIEPVFRVRYVSVVAVVFGAVGAAFMFLIGAVTTIQAIGLYFGSGEEEALSNEAALEATVEIVGSLDQFLLGLFLLVFAYGVYGLWVVADREKWAEQRDVVKAPDWLRVGGVTDLKVKLIEVIAVILTVLFLKRILSVGLEGETSWTLLVIPIAVALFALTVWLLRQAED